MPRRGVKGATRHADGSTHRDGLGPAGLVGHPDSGQPPRSRDRVLPERRGTGPSDRANSRDAQAIRPGACIAAM